MAYIALYRTYRPQNFSEVQGQVSITKTLKNAVKTGQVSHAYIFSGPRGTGKTSIAKIIAKALNCEHAIDGEPCNECENCKSINKQTFSDVFEIDAASNRGVDQIRDIRGNVNYLPAQGKYKVYIIDEAHMLTEEAWNALLKTLEEPPKYAVFILATTEPYKIPLTILSRCQRFDFQGLTVEEIKDQLSKIVQKENINIEEEALLTIAETSDGGMRDAISLLDQARSFNSNLITVSDIDLICGSVSTKKIIEILSSCADSNPTNSLTLIDEIIKEGKEVPKIINDLIMFLRDILIFKNVGILEGKNIFKTDDFKNLCSKLTNNQVYSYLYELQKTQELIKTTNQKRAFLELSIIKLSDKVSNDYSQIIDRVDELERRFNDAINNDKSISLNANIIKDIPTEPFEEDKPIIPVKKVEQNDENYISVSDVKNILINGNKSLLSKIKNICFNADVEFENVIIRRLINNSEVVATSDTCSLFVCKDIMTANSLMRFDIKEKVLNALNPLGIGDYIAIVKEHWQTISQEFIQKWKSGDHNPKLTDIFIGVKKTVKNEVKNEVKSLDEKTQEILDIFDNDIVTIKE